jgi:uncharacterized membrane protein YkoI
MAFPARIFAALITGGFLLAGPGARADGDTDGDHDRARELVEHGDIRSLPDIVHDLRGKVPGDIVDVYLGQRGDRWVYEFMIVTSDGRRLQVGVDAASMQIVDQIGGQ